MQTDLTLDLRALVYRLIREGAMQAHHEMTSAERPFHPEEIAHVIAAAAVHELATVFPSLQLNS